MLRGKLRHCLLVGPSLAFVVNVRLHIGIVADLIASGACRISKTPVGPGREVGCVRTDFAPTVPHKADIINKMRITLRYFP